MTSENLYEAIGDISDKKIKEAKQVRKSKQPSWIKWGAMVACLCLVVVGSTILLKQDFNFLDVGNESNLDGTEEVMVQASSDVQSEVQSEVHEETIVAVGSEPAVTKPLRLTAVPVDLYSAERAVFLNNLNQSGTSTVTPSVESYSVAADLSNIINLDKFYIEPDSEMVKKLVKNGFVVTGSAGYEFFEIYEKNRYRKIPNFVTVDSLMHTYHLYFSHLLKNIELDYLAGGLSDLSAQMLENSMEQYEQLKGSEWESAALRNVAFFTIGAKLLDEDTSVDDAVKAVVVAELDKINRAEGMELSEITGAYEDYTQYIPRGYYEGNERLEAYFRAMMWYGRVHFEQDMEDLDRSALLITMALAEDVEAAGLWEAIYTVTTFFAGASDDLMVYEYAPLIQQVYGAAVGTKGLIGNEAAFAAFHQETAKLRAPQINSVPIGNGENNEILGFRFMGQRFTIDATIMQNLIYSRVGVNNEGERRMLPDVLDVPAALGSDAALDILEENGATEYAGYTENMNKLRAGLSMENTALWNASLYANWLNTLRPLLTEKGKGYPMFMQNEEWMKKNLECFAGSFTELKHDTILYAKQVIAEMGGYNVEDADDRGYVEPEPLVYERFVYLAEMTAKGLKEYGMLSEVEEENLSRLVLIAEKLLTISNKELQDKVLTDEEYDFIKGYGGNIEHFWYEVVRDEKDSYIDAGEYPAAVVVDIATDPNGTVLETATGNPSRIIVAVKVDGKIKLAQGSVYSFYQFEWPMDDRLTDTKWRLMMGIQPDEEWNYVTEKPIKQPEWTASYRYEHD